MTPARIVRVALLSLALGALLPQTVAEVKITEADGRLRIEVDDEFFANYEFSGGSRPYLYPILLPGGIALSRDWPMKDVPGEEHDHPHHRSLWWAHGELNGVDFWSESDKAGRTVHQKFLELRSGSAGVIRSTNSLVAKDGKLIATDDRTLTVRADGSARILDFSVTVHASAGALEFGDTKEGTMAIRLNEQLRLKPNKDRTGKPVGHIVNSAGVRDDATWGKRADWVDYHGAVDGAEVGVAILDHPSNPRHPTWWHVRDYGLFAANPFGVHDFEQKPAGTGKFEVPAGGSVTFRYRFIFHRGDETAARIAARYSDFAAQP